MVFLVSVSRIIDEIPLRLLFHILLSVVPMTVMFLCMSMKIEYTWLTGTSGSPGEFIIKVAKEQEVDMVIMGARGLGKIKKTILGSVSDHVLNKAKVPVLIFKGQ